MSSSVPPTLFSHLLTIHDPRRSASVEHPLSSILFIAVCAVICGADSWVEMEEWGKAKESWLSGFLALPHGIPSHDTFLRVFSLLSPQQFSIAFIAWMQEITTLTEGAVVAIDGKSVRRSRCRSTNSPAIPMVSAFAAENGVVLGQVKTEKKSNEITAIPALLDLLEVKGCLVTVDAMGCQKAIVEKIREKEGDYLIQVKGNQPKLHGIVQETLELGLSEGVEELGGSSARLVERGSGQEVTREVWVMPAPDDLFDLDQWKDVRSLILAQRTVREGREVTVGRRLFLSSAPPHEATRFLHAIRLHWTVENNLHWCLDVAFDEDHAHTRDHDAAQNMVRLRHVALNLLKAEKSAKVGIKVKRSKAGWDDKYLLKLLNQAL